MIYLISAWCGVSLAIAWMLYHEDADIPRYIQWVFVLFAPITAVTALCLLIHDAFAQMPRNHLGALNAATPPSHEVDHTEEWPLPTDAEIAEQMAYMPNVASGHIIAWKSWSLGGDLLGGMFGPSWTPNAPYVAVNMIDNHMYGAGIYAAKEKTSEITSKTVYGQVALWGQVIEHENGYRARYAYPVKLYLHGSEEQARRLGEYYNVSCEAVEYASPVGRSSSTFSVAGMVGQQHVAMPNQLTTQLAQQLHAPSVLSQRAPK